MPLFIWLIVANLEDVLLMESDEKMDEIDVVEDAVAMEWDGIWRKD
jgi:hypothetical protein